MKKINTIKTHRDFTEIIKTGNFKKNNFFVIYYKDSNEHTKFGIAISKKMGNAVERNKYKRQIRMIIDQNQKRFKNNQNYIIMIRERASSLKFSELKIKLEELIEAINEKQN